MFLYVCPGHYKCPRKILSLLHPDVALIEEKRSEYSWLGVIPRECLEEEEGDTILDYNCVEGLIRENQGELRALFGKVIARCHDTLGLAAITNTPVLPPWGPTTVASIEQSDVTVKALWLRDYEKKGLESNALAILAKLLTAKICWNRDPFFAAFTALWTPFTPPLEILEKKCQGKRLHGGLTLFA